MRLDSLIAAVTGRRGRLVTIAVWIPLAIAGFLGRSHLDDVTSAGQSSFLPADAQSTRVVDDLATKFSGGDDVPALIVFSRDGGLTKADRKAIGAVGPGLNALGIRGATTVIDPLTPQAREIFGGVPPIVQKEAGKVGVPVSRDGEAALVALALDANDRGAISDGVEEIRSYLEQNAVPGLEANVTGPAGIAADLEDVADDAGRTLLLATIGLVLVLLLAVYRAPLLAILPLVVTGFAYLVACGITYLLIESGAITINVEGTFLLLVLIFGAGTDYSLLLVHRYREELGKGRDLVDALRTGVQESVEALTASAGTVCAAMLVLLVADLESTRWLGPILAVGIATMLIASLTLLPALLSVSGARAFWPKREISASAPAGVWDRLSHLITTRSRTLIVVIAIGLLAAAAGNFVNHGTIGFGQGETKTTDSSRGTDQLNAHFPPGLGSPLTAIVAADLAETVVEDIQKQPEVDFAFPVKPSTNGELVLVGIVLNGDPYGGVANEDVEEIRSQVKKVDPAALIGGVPAENLDIEDANARDTKLIIPLVLAVVFVILSLLLRALVVPLYLTVTVVASFAATLGLTTVLFTEVFNAEGLAFNLEILAFIFLVALGVDYNIFLMDRARRETATLGARNGILTALVNTGGVVTGAGIILAGTFATLILLPLEELKQIGAAVALGVLLDTFVVRAMLVPAITYVLGDRAWWPGRPGRTGS
jgi:putative drug exporter of the RND superfamily